MKRYSRSFTEPSYSPGSYTAANIEAIILRRSVVRSCDGLHNSKTRLHSSRIAELGFVDDRCERLCSH